MVNCRQSRKLIDLYLDGEADVSQTKRMFLHMKECRECQARFEEVEKLHNTIKSVPDAELPAGFRNLVMESIRPENHRFAIRRPVMLWGSVVVLVILILAMTWRVYHTSEVIQDIPEIYIVSPREDSVVDQSYVDISAAFSPASVDSIRVILDGKDVTEVTEVNEDFIIHASDELRSGYHIATVLIMGHKGTPINQRSWAFYIMQTESS